MNYEFTLSVQMPRTQAKSMPFYQECPIFALADRHGIIYLPKGCTPKVIHILHTHSDRDTTLHLMSIMYTIETRTQRKSNL